MLRLEVRDSGRFWYVLIPELCGTGGWVDISRKFWAFCGWKSSEGSVDSRSFKEVAEIGGWPANTVAVKGKGRRCRGCDVEVIAESTQSFMTYLGRCLVGKMENEALGLPTAMEVQRWAQKMWKVTVGVQISDLGGASFLVSLPSVEEAQRVVKGCWSFGGRKLELEWWSPVGNCVKKGEVASEVWVRSLGLPLHLWDMEVFRAIGDSFGAFLHVDEDTRQRAHFRWARFAVRAIPALIPATVKIALGGWIYEVPLWVEKGPRVIFQSDVVFERGGGGGFAGVPEGPVVEGGRKKMTRVGSARGASGERGVGFFGSRINGRSSNFELGSDSGFGPGRVLGWREMQPRPQNGCGPRRVVGRREMQLGSSDGPVGKSNSTLSHFKREQVDKWAFLFKRPFKSKLVAIKNKKWVRRRDPGAGPSFRGEDGVVTIDGGCRETTCSSKRQPECVSYQQSFPASVDSSKVCMISERFSPSLPPSFSFAEERRGGVNSKDLGGLDVSATAVCFGR